MKNTASYTSTLPTEVMLQLDDFAKRLKMPKNKLIEISLKKYFAELRRKALVESFKRAAQDHEMIEMAEEGIGEYAQNLEQS